MLSENSGIPGQINSLGERRLIHEIHNALQIFRTLLQDDKNLCNSIDETYEEMLICDLQTVPEQYDPMILDALSIIKIFINNVNFIKISDELSRYSNNKMKLEIDTFQIFEKAIDRLEMTKKDKARIMNVSTKFKPIFQCVNRLLYKPIELVRRIGTMRNNMLGDLF